MRALFHVLCIAALMAGCGQDAPTWQKILGARITDEYPKFEVEVLPDGKLLVHRPGLPEKLVDVDEIALLCQRGPRDCNRATDQMIDALRPSAK